MKTVLYIISLAYAVLLGYIVGQVQPQVVTPDKRAIEREIVRQDQGCNDIRYDTSTRTLVCEVYMTEEDDALFIIKKEGTHDDYK